MKANQLIKDLQKAIELGGDMEVLTEGCDCYGTAARVEIFEMKSSDCGYRAQKYIMIFRYERTDASHDRLENK